MAINSFPSSGGGGMPNMNYIGSILMETYNRTWNQAGSSGNYGVYSADGSSGYAYFVGPGMTTGVSLNRVINVPHDFTSINIVAPQNDMVTLYKAQLKATTAFPNPLASMTVNPAVIIASGNFELPTNATVPFADITVVGAGGASGAGHGGTHGGGGGGGGGNVVNLTDYPVYGTTIVSVGFGGVASRVNRGTSGGQSAFGPVYALGGGGGGGWDTRPGLSAGNGGGGGAGGGGTGGSGTTQSTSSGLGTVGSPIFRGGYSGGSGHGGTGSPSRGGGGGGALGAGQDGSHNGGGNGGAGWVSSITGNQATFGAGGYGIDPNSNYGTGWSGLAFGCGGQNTINGHSGDTPVGVAGQNGVVVVRFYTP